MNSQGRASIRFTLNGQRCELSREDVESRLADVAPDAIRKHAVRVMPGRFRQSGGLNTANPAVGRLSHEST